MMQVRCGLGGSSHCQCCINDAALTRLVSQIDVDSVSRRWISPGGREKLWEGNEKRERDLRRSKNLIRPDIYT